MGGRGDAQQFVDVDVVASKAMSRFSGALDQRFESQNAGLTVIFVEWHPKTTPPGLIVRAD